MPELKCVVKTCVHNKEHCCDKNDIKVSGNAAKTKSETCCDSFQDSSMTSYTNSNKSASLYSAINCDATNCTHNNMCECVATNVEVNGSNACQCCDTECSSFCAK